MAKKKEVKKEVKMTPTLRAYQLTLEGLQDAYVRYAGGVAQNDPEFNTPGRQRKVAKQIAKMHNRILKKSKLDMGELDEEVGAE